MIWIPNQILPMIGFPTCDNCNIFWWLKLVSIGRIHIEPFSHLQWLRGDKVWGTFIIFKCLFQHTTTDFLQLLFQLEQTHKSIKCRPSHRWCHWPHAPHVPTLIWLRVPLYQVLTGQWSSSGSPTSTHEESLPGRSISGSQLATGSCPHYFYK